MSASAVRGAVKSKGPRGWRIVRWVFAGALGSGVALTAAAANANGYQSVVYGASLGSPASPNIFSIYFNPAALAGMQGTEITAEAAVAYRHITYDRSADALSPAGSSKSDPVYVAANTGKATLSNVGAVPFAGIVTDFKTKNFRLGLAAYTPFGGQASYGKNASWQGREDAPGAYDGPQRWSIIDGSLISVYGTLAAAYRVIPQLSVGASLSVSYNSADFVNARNATGTDDVRDAKGNLIEGRALVRGSGATAAGTIGVYWDPRGDNSVRVGLSYISQPGFGELHLRGNFQLQEGASVAPVTADSVDVRYSLPDLIRLGGGYRLGKSFELRADLEYVRWSVFNKQCVTAAGSSCNVDKNGNVLASEGGVKVSVPRLWQDIIAGRLGASWFASDNVEAFMSVGFSPSPVPKTTIDAATVDSTRFYGTLGARVRLDPRVWVQAAITQIYFSDVDTGGIQSRNLAAGLYSGSSKVPSADGVYTQSITYGNLSVSVRF